MTAHQPLDSTHRSDVVRHLAKVSIGFLLLIAGIAKLFSFSADLASQYFYFFGPVLFIVIVLSEVALGCWFLVARPSQTMRTVGGLFFIGLTAVSMANAISGKVSCGCFGSSITISPVWMMLIDLSAIALIICCWPKRCIPNWSKTNLTLASCARWLFTVAAAGLIAIVGVNAGSQFRKVTSELVYVKPASLNLGRLSCGERTEHHVTVVNSTNETVTLLGGVSAKPISLKCEFPIEVAKGDEIDLVFDVLPFNSNRENKIQRDIVFWTNASNQPVIRGRMFAWIRQ